MILYPILLNLRGALCVIVGGGEVARRKIAHLLEAGARVRVVAPKSHQQIQLWSREKKLELVRGRYHEQQLEGARLVFSCTDDPMINRSVAQDASALGIPLNAAETPDDGDFHVPSMVRRGSLLLTVSTGGKSPALSRELCHRLEQQFGPAWGGFTDLLGELRDKWKSAGESASIHQRMLEIIASDTFEVLQSSGPNAARKHVAQLLNRAKTSNKTRRARATKQQGGRNP